MHIAFYISSHGYGHAARQQRTVHLLSQQGIHVHIRTLAPAKFFPTASSYHAQRYDIGMIQNDPLRYEISETAMWYEQFIAQEEVLIAQELAFIKQSNITLVLSDMPPIACEIAQRADIPCVLMTHFTWDWVYEHYVAREARFAPIVQHITAQYSTATLALQMPFAHEFSQFSHVQPIGIFCNPLSKTREEVWAEFYIPPQHKMVLLSMGGHSWGRTDISALAQRTDWTFLVMPQVYEQVQHLPHFRLVPMAYEGYHNLIGACDVLVGKAGGSTVNEVIAHRAPMIYTLATDWRECELLDKALRTYAHSYYLPLDAFERGDWVSLLDTFITHADARQALDIPIDIHGADQAVDIILGMISN